MKVTEGAAGDQDEESAGQQPSAPRRPMIEEMRVNSEKTTALGMPRWAWIALILLCAVIVGGIAGLLAHADEATVPRAILTGGGAFAGTVVLLLAIAHFAGVERL